MPPCSWRSIRSTGSSSSSRKRAAGRARARLRGTCSRSHGRPRALRAPCSGPLVDLDDRLDLARRLRRARRLAGSGARRGLFVVFDLETTGLAVASSRICEIGAVRIRGRARQDGLFETLVAPGVPLPRQVGPPHRALPTPSCAGARRAPGARGSSGVRRRRRARRPQRPLRRRLRQPGARADDRQAGRGDRDRHGAARPEPAPWAGSSGRASRRSRTSSASRCSPCHRALPDAQATAEVFLRLVELALERGASTLAELEELAAPRPRRIHGKRHLVHGAPPRPASTSSATRAAKCSTSARRATSGAAAVVLPDGTPATDRRSGARPARSRRVAAHGLRAGGRARGGAADPRASPGREHPHARAGALRLPPSPWRARRRQPSPLLVRPVQAPRTGTESRCGRSRGVLPRSSTNCSTARSLDRLRSRLASLTEADEELEARYLRRRIGSLERAIAHLRRLERLRELEVCVLAPSLEPGRMDAYIVSGGRLVGPGSDTRTRAIRHGRVRAEELDALLVMEAFLLRPPAELTIIPLGRRDCRRAA